MNKNPYKTNIQIVLLEECVISSVLSRYGKILKQWKDRCYSSMLQLSFIWQAKENTSSRCEGGPTQKIRSKARGSILAPLFSFFLLPLSLPCVNWASQEGCLFHLRFSLQSSDLPLFYLCRLFPSLSFSHHF